MWSVSEFEILISDDTIGLILKASVDALPFLSLFPPLQFILTHHVCQELCRSTPSPTRYLPWILYDSIQETISSHKITVFSKSSCPYCRRAKTLFKDNYPNADIGIIEFVIPLNQ